MKNIKALLMALALVFFVVVSVNAQAPESIWLEAPTTNYKTEELVTIQVHALASTPIQGFTFQIRYDPNCLKPLNASSPIAGMNGLQLPQNSGLVDASFAGAAPQAASGLIAEVFFQALGGCQTELYLEQAALAVRDENGFAAPLTNISLGQRQAFLQIDSQVGNAVVPQAVGESLSLEPVDAPGSAPNIWLDKIMPVIMFLVFLTGLSLLGVAVFLIYKRATQATERL